MANDSKIIATINAAIADPSKKVERYSPKGCGRVYIVPVGAGGIAIDPADALSKEEAKINKATLKRLAPCFGLRWIENLKCLYVGYDNNTAYELNKAATLVYAFNSAGLRCYMDCDGD